MDEDTRYRCWMGGWSAANIGRRADDDDDEDDAAAEAVRTPDVEAVDPKFPDPDPTPTPRLDLNCARDMAAHPIEAAAATKRMRQKVGRFHRGCSAPDGPCGDPSPDIFTQRV